jgi:hypothetical protein
VKTAVFEDRQVVVNGFDQYQNGDGHAALLKNVGGFAEVVMSVLPIPGKSLKDSRLLAAEMIDKGSWRGAVWVKDRSAGQEREQEQDQKSQPAAAPARQIEDATVAAVSESQAYRSSAKSLLLLANPGQSRPCFGQGAACRIFPTRPDRVASDRNAEIPPDE